MERISEHEWWLIGGLVIAHARTAEKLADLAGCDWNDDANVNEHIRDAFAV